MYRHATKGRLATSDLQSLLEQNLRPGHKDRIKIYKLLIQFILVGGNIQPLGGSIVQKLEWLSIASIPVMEEADAFVPPVR